MRINGKTCMLCSCEGTMRSGAGAIGAGAPVVHHALCVKDMVAFDEALATGEPLLVACEQEAPAFTARREALGVGGDLTFIDVRDRDGWTQSPNPARVLALLVDAALDVPPAPAVEIESAGRCLVLASDAAGVEAAARLGETLAVTLVLTKVPDDAAPPRVRSLGVLRGRVAGLRGSLGRFRLTLDHPAAMRPSSRDAFAFARPAEAPADLEADLVLDLRGEGALVTGEAKRDGYLRADPARPASVLDATLRLQGLVGSFEKPRYVAYDAGLCAHSRSKRVGCTRCLDHCPTGAITSVGDVVAIDPNVCAGCGACGALCPTGAATYAAPPPEHQAARLKAMLAAWHGADGGPVTLLAYEAAHGDPILTASARAGSGLPGHVLPFRTDNVPQLGLDLLLSAVAYGSGRVAVLLPVAKRHECGSIEAVLGHANAVLEGLGHAARLDLLVEDDPDALIEAFGPAPPAGPPPASYLALGSRRDRLRLALDRLHAVAPAPADTVSLPEGAPIGRIVVDAPGCTLCLACVGACPTGAIIDSADRPTLRFLEDACVQCGLCQSTCPERVISLDPRANFTPEAKAPVTLKEEAPATCVRCGTAFGTQSTIERVARQLAAAHPMFEGKSADIIRMCADCRVKAQFEADAPMKGEAPRRPRTRDDYR